MNRTRPQFAIVTLALIGGLLPVASRAVTHAATPSRSSSSVAHPVSIVNADIYVDRSRITMKLTCFAEDLELLQGVEALDSGLYNSDELRDATKDHATYLAERVQILDLNGEPLAAKITEVIDFEIPADGIPAGELMQYQMAFVLEYQLTQPPEFLTVQQNMIADGALLPSEMKILLKQAGSETPYTHLMKPGSPETFRLDWDNPALAPDAAEEDWEDWFEDQREKTLGIDSYSSTYSFVYINDHEVRHEVLIPLATLAALIDFQRADERFLEVAEQTAAREKIEAWFSSGNPVAVDGETIPPTFDRIDFYGLDLRDFAVQADARRVSMASGRVGVILSYPAASPPTKVEVTWDMFNHAIRSVDSVILAYDDAQTTAFSKFLANNTFTWEAPRPGELPTITPVVANIDAKYLEQPTWQISWLFGATLLLAAVPWLLKTIFKLPTGTTAAASVLAFIAGGALIASTANNRILAELPNPFAARPTFTIESSEADTVFRRVHANLFRAFDYRDESQIYDALAQTVDGPLLRRLYLDINRSLKIREQGGAVANIEQVELVSSQPADVPVDSANVALTQSADSNESLFRFGWQSRWNLSGSVEHWGHIHQRINQYDANFTVAERDGYWKITDLHMTNNEGTVKTSLRKLQN